MTVLADHALIQAVPFVVPMLVVVVGITLLMVRDRARHRRDGR